MAGGWNQQGSGVPSERVRAGHAAPLIRPSSATQSAAQLAAQACPMRHCWISDAGVRRPGLLVEWRQVETRWEGRVLYAAQLRPPAWVVVEEWLPAALLTPL